VVGGEGGKAVRREPPPVRSDCVCAACSLLSLFHDTWLINMGTWFEHGQNTGPTTQSRCVRGLPKVLVEMAAATLFELGRLFPVRVCC
jgi:hypothetical protein